MLEPRDLELTLRQKERLERLWKRYAREALPSELPSIIADRLEVDLGARFGPLDLPNPFIVAAGEMSQDLSQIEKAAQAGWGAVVLRSVAAEDASGACPLQAERAKPDASGAPTEYESSDRRRVRPVVRWHGRLDARSLEEYAAFAAASVQMLGSSRTQLIGSFTGPMPRPGEPLDPAWGHTSQRLARTGLRVLEIPFPGDFGSTSAEEAAGLALAFVQSAEGLLRESEAALWCKAHTSSMILAACACATASVAVRPEGLTVANRAVFRQLVPRSETRAAIASDLATASCLGLSERFSASGGVYTGLHALDYILSGASTVQVYSFIAGKVSEPPKRSFNKFEQVFYKLLLDPSDGLVAGLLHLKNTRGIDSVRQAVGADRKA